MWYSSESGIPSDLPVKGVPDDLVVIKIPIEGKESEAMLDSGGGLSVKDHDLAQQFKVPIEKVEGNLHAFDYTNVPVIGTVELKFTVGNQVMTHKCFVIDPKQKRSVMILGRDFQRKFGRTVFDWENNRIQLGENWFYPQTWLRGGDVKSRMSMINDTHFNDDDEAVRHEKVSWWPH